MKHCNLPELRLGLVKGFYRQSIQDEQSTHQRTQARPNHYQLTSPHGTNGQPRHDGADTNLTVNVNPGSHVQDIVVIINVRDLNCNDLFVIRR